MGRNRTSEDDERRRRMKKTIFFSAIVLILIGSLVYMQLQINQLKSVVTAKHNQVQKEAMYAWDDLTYRTENRVDTLMNLEQLNISTLYQSIDKEELFSNDFVSFVQQAKRLNIEVVYLCGQAEWAEDIQAKSMKEEIDKIVMFNQAVGPEAQIEWINFDVEPHLTQQWDDNRDELMNQFLTAMREAYAYANSKGIKVTLCIAHWLDNQYGEIVEELIKNACDEISIMNYDRSDEVSNMESELAIAKKYNKRIVCIFELQKPGKHDLEPINTYYDLGVEKAKERFEELREIFDYEGLSFAYHYYTPIIKMNR